MFNIELEKMQLYIYCTWDISVHCDNKYCCKVICSIYAVPYEVKII